MENQCLVQYLVPAKDRSFLEDMAKVQGAVRKTQAAKPSRRLIGLEKAIQEVERGEIFSAASVDDVFEQILGKGRRKVRTGTHAELYKK
ncbi:MAG: hypothetical protein NC324_04920 [Bacteroides sp.]|nr:hypothetical protein [Bacteroides sp.]